MDKRTYVTQNALNLEIRLSKRLPNSYNLEIYILLFLNRRYYWQPLVREDMQM